MIDERDRKSDVRFSLRRWSARKLEAARATPGPSVPIDAAPVDAAPAAPAPTVAQTPGGAPLAKSADTPAGAPLAKSADTPTGAPELPPVESLTFESDFTAFLQPSVAQSVRQQALKKLFTDPRFNVMDGLDVYIDDYSIPSPLEPELIEQLLHARFTLNPPRTRVNAQGEVEDVHPDEPAPTVAAADDAPAGDGADPREPQCAEQVTSGDADQDTALPAPDAAPSLGESKRR